MRTGLNKYSISVDTLLFGRLDDYMWTIGRSCLDDWSLLFGRLVDDIILFIKKKQEFIMYHRVVTKKINTALEDTPAVVLVGPRQCGKTTLVKQLITEKAWRFVTLDDINQCQFAKSDPIGFITSYADKRLVIDEVQRAPELFLPIKQAIDDNRVPGRFILTGSANAMMLPTVADSLAGRMEVISLFPLAQCEILGKQPTFLKKFLSGVAPETQHIRVRDELINKIMAGGFPEALSRKTESRRVAWFHQYILSVVQKDMKDLGDLEYLKIAPRLIQILCQQSGNLINYTAVSDALGVSRQTITRYLQLLEQLFLYHALPAWHRKEHKRLIKTPKAHIVDSGLLCALRKINKEKINKDATLLGYVLENYILCELQRLGSFYEEPLFFYHFRDKEQYEVDVVIETMSGEVFGVEIKSSATIRTEDFKGMKRLKEAAGKSFCAGIILYDGDHTNIVDGNIFSAPVATLWE